ncbi:MAG: MSCRAMM family protein [Bacteroidota bacterium]
MSGIQPSFLRKLLHCLGAATAVLPIATLSLHAQAGWTATMTIQPYPSPYVSDWQSNPTIAILTVNNAGRPSQIKMFLTITRRPGGEFVGSGESNPIFVPAGQTVLNNTSMVSWGSLKYDKSLEGQIVQTGRLPEGEYRACVDIKDFSGNTLVAQLCGDFTIVYPDPPYLVAPADGDTVQTQYPVFQWTPCQVPAQYQLHYGLRIVEVLPGQIPEQALVANVPQYENPNILTTNFQYPISALPLQAGKKYAWQVQALDQYGLPPAANNGKSQIWNFVYRVDTLGVGGRAAGAPVRGHGNRRLAGVLRDFFTNEPVPNATVVYHQVSRGIYTGFAARTPYTYTETADSLTTLTDSDGKFEFLGVRDSTFFSLRAAKSGYIPALDIGPGQYQAGDITNYTMIITPNYWTLTGRLVDSVRNTPVKNTTIELRRQLPLPLGVGVVSIPIASARTDSNGYFRFERVDGNAGYYFKVSDPRYRVLVTSRFSIPGTARSFIGPGGRTLNKGTYLLIPKVGTIEGWVKEEGTNKPLPGAQVYLYPDVGPAIIGGARFLGSTGLSSRGLDSISWNPALGNVSQYRGFNSYLNSRSNNFPYAWPSDSTAARFNNEEGGGGGGGEGEPPEQGPQHQQEQIGGWADMSAWSPRPSQLGGAQPPPRKPDSPPLLGPVQTDENGHFVLTNVPINDPYQSTDRYAVWAQTPGYYDAWKSARISAEGQTASVTITTRKAKGIIYGKVTSAADNSPVANARVELQVPGGPSVGSYIYVFGVPIPFLDNYTTVKTAYTNTDGSYTLFDIDSGSYARVRFIKSGFQTYIAQGPITIGNGTFIELNVALTGNFGIVKGSVKDDGNHPLYGVTINSPDAPTISAVSLRDGTFLIPNVPEGRIRFVFHQPGFSDVLDTVNVIRNDTARTTVTMTGYKGSITVLVQDSTSNQPIVNARVKLGGMPTRVTDNRGRAAFLNVPVGPKSVQVIPPSSPSDSLDYRSRSTNIIISQGVNSPLVLKLLRGTRISGTVVRGDDPSVKISGVEVALEGVPGIKDTTDSNGEFTLRNVPAGDTLTIAATKTGFKSSYLRQIFLSAGEHRSGIQIQLEVTPIDSIFGFAVQVDSIRDIDGGHKLVRGALINVPSNPVVKLKDASFKFYFDSLEVDGSFHPTGSAVDLSVTEAPVEIFGMKGKLKDTTGAFLRVAWIDSIHTGHIKGNAVVMDQLIPSWIPGSQWATEKVTAGVGMLSPGLWADGAYHGLSNLGINVTGTSVQAKFWGFELSVDYTKTTVNSSGFHYYGSLKIPGISSAIVFEDLNIKKDSAGGGVKFDHVTIKTTPPISLNLGKFTIVDSSASWDASGFRANGAIVLTALGNRKFGFQDLRIAPNGDFLSITVHADPASGTITVLGAQFQIQSVSFGTDGSSHKKFFSFTGGLTLPRLSNPIQFQNLKYTQDGDFTGTIQFNQSVTFASVVTLELWVVQFYQGSHGKYIFVGGGIAFNIPALQVQVGNFRFYEDGSFALDRIGIGFTAGPVQVAISASWSNNVFEGSGTLIVQPAFSAQGEFRYGGSSNWWIKVKAGVNIPVGPFTIVGVSGELGRNNNVWTFGLGGSVTVGQAQRAIRLDIYVQVVTSPSGPVINGSADVMVMSNVAIGHATVTLDYPNNRFAGNINFGWSRLGITVSQQVDIEVRSGQYWFVGAGVNLNIFSFASLHGTVYVARNYSGYMHTLPVMYHPDNQAINGLHLDVTFHLGASGSRWSINADAWAFAAVDWNQNLSGGVHLAASGHFDIWVVSGNGNFDLQAALQYQANQLKAHGSVSFNMKLWTWPCDSGTDCGDYCFPTGATRCFDISVTADYSSGSGWSWSVNW